jgi:hypothetical protein
VPFVQANGHSHRSLPLGFASSTGELCQSVVSLPKFLVSFWFL